MTYLIRAVLIFIIVFLIARSFFRYGAVEGEKENGSEAAKRKREERKKISKETGEYVDYEEIKKK